MPEGLKPDDRGPMPESFTRKLSPEEEKNVLVNFMGNMYADTRKIDSNIVGPSTTLERGKSEKIKQQIEQVISQPQQPVPQVQAAPPPPTIVPQPPEQAQQPVIPVQQVVVQPQIDDNQLSFNFNVSEKEDLLNNVDTLLIKVKNLNKDLNTLNNKIDKLTEMMIADNKPSKKKSVEPKKET